MQSSHATHAVEVVRKFTTLAVRLLLYFSQYLPICTILMDNHIPFIPVPVGTYTYMYTVRRNVHRTWVLLMYSSE